MQKSPAFVIGGAGEFRIGLELLQERLRHVDGHWMFCCAPVDRFCRRTTKNSLEKAAAGSSVEPLWRQHFNLDRISEVKAPGLVMLSPPVAISRFTLHDPDGNTVLIDQHVAKPKQ